MMFLNSPWRDTIIHVVDPDYSREELKEIRTAASMDYLTVAEMRTLVIQLANAAERSRNRLMERQQADDPGHPDNRPFQRGDPGHPDNDMGM